MLISVLASGSKGNSTLIKTDKLNILIDIGMNYKYIKDNLMYFDLLPKDINYIFLTHVHKDHISALETFIKTNNPTICLGRKMLKELNFLKNYDHIILLDSILELEDVIVEIFNTSHDTSESFGYIFNNKDKSLVYITDTGYINNKFFDRLTNKNMYILESNHDVEMLMHGSYPPWLKTRVLSDKGHLSNKSSAFYLSRFIGDNTNYVVLAHLSLENNTPEIALSTLKETLEEYDVSFDNIYIASQNEKTKEFKI